VIPAAAQGVLCGEDPLSGVSMDACLNANGDYF
jgi:hypothetical protein